jgi:glycosyltransferase involved in cell wall biosynthesis
MKFPFIIFFRDDKYKEIDQFFIKNTEILNCSVYIVNNFKKVEKLHNSNFHLLITYGEDFSEYRDNILQIISEKMLVRHFHMKEIDNVDSFNRIVNDKFIANCSFDRDLLRPTFSLFTPSYNSYHKIMRVYESLKAQTLKDWEWIIMDDSPDDKHFDFLRKNMLHDNRIRFYRHSHNNGSIGNVKNETVSLCRGKYVLEMDHDDEILPFVLQESADLFDSNPEVGFIYMDFICVYESGKNQWYGDFLCKGYGGYYSMKHNNQWRLVYITPNINNITLSHLVCCPNHPRIWRRDALLQMGNYCEYLHICDDYEILLRTAVNYKMAKIHKMGYIQYMNNDDNNFSIIRNKEINRIGPNHISPIYYDLYKINDKMKELDGYEDEKYISHHSKIWLREPEYVHNYCNLLVNTDYDCQICIIGYDSLLYYMDHIKTLYENPRNDFLLLETKCSNEYLWKRLENLNLDRMKCYTLPDHTNKQLIKYFATMYSSTSVYEIYNVNIENPQYNTSLNSIHEVINSLTLSTDTYLEIGIEYGTTFNNIHCINKKGIDPDPKCKNTENIFLETSDEYFQKNNDQNIKYDVVLIDGMHQLEYVIKDINNSINILNDNGSIFLSDVFPINYNEQLKIPNKHHFENGILKYGEEWTGDVWKVLYYILLNYKDKLTIQYFNNKNYRGIVHIKINEPFSIPNKTDVIEEMNNYDYFNDYSQYLNLLVENK